MRSKALALLVLLLVSAASASPVYDVIDLGTLPNCRWSSALSINNSRQIVGWTSTSSSSKATLFDSTGNGNNIDLGTLGGIDSYAYSINDNGQIVGYAKNASGWNRATIFDSTDSGNNIDLGTLGGDRSSAFSNNNRDQVVGYSYNAAGQIRATLFNSPSNNIDLGTLGGSESVAYSINNNGQIVGSAHNASGEYRATLFDPTGDGNNIDLGTLDGSESRAKSINNNGQIVGEADGRATLFDPTGGGNNIDLGTLGGRESRAFSINNNGQIVGWANNEKGNERATLFDPTGSGNNIDLNTLIDPNLDWILRTAFSINDNGWIVGWGYNPAGQGRAFLLTPEPSTPPVADADGPYTINVGDTLMLDASDSTDDDNDIVSYMWDLDDDENFETDAGGQTIFDVNYAYLQSLGLIVGDTYDIHVQVIDSAGHSDIADSTLTIVSERALKATVDLAPDVFEVKVKVPKGPKKPKEPKERFLGAFIELPADVNVADVDVNTVTLSLNGTMLATAEEPLIVDNILDVLFSLDCNNAGTILGSEVTKVKVVHDKIKVETTAAPSQTVNLIELTVSGELMDGGSFIGTDAVRVMLKEHKKHHGE